MRRLLACALVALIIPALPAASAGVAPRAAWWDEAWHFRAHLRVGTSGVDPVTGGSVQLVGDEAATVMLPVDLSAALAAEGKWPVDAAGAPTAWTLAPDSMRLLAVDGAGRAVGEPLPAAFFPNATSYDASTRATGLLAARLPGPWDAERGLDLYFDIRQNAPKPAAAAPPGLFDGAAATGFLARVPPAPREGAWRLVAIAQSPAQLRVDRLHPGAAAERLADAWSVASHEPARLELPDGDYDIRVGATAPVLLALEATSGPATSFVTPSWEGGEAGMMLDAVPLGAGTQFDLVGTQSRTQVQVDGGASFELGRLGVAPFAVPAGSLARVSASAPVVLLARGGADAFLAKAASIAPGLSVGERGAGHALVASAPVAAQAFPLASPQSALNGRAGDAGRAAWVSRAAPATTSAPWAFLAPGVASVTMLGSDGVFATGGLDMTLPLIATQDDPAHPLVVTLESPVAGTTLSWERRGPDGALVGSGSATLSRPSSLASDPESGAPLAREGETVRVRADNPIFLVVARPGGGGATFLPGLPPRLTTRTAGLDSWGHQIAWSETSKELRVRPGENVRVEMQLSNSGRASNGAPIVEDVTLALEPEGAACQAAWDATLPEGSLAQVDSPATRVALVLVRVPPSAQDGDCAAYVLRASAGGLSTEARLSVRARAGFEPQLRVLGASGELASQASLLLAAGEPGAARLVLRNVGATAGTARLAFAGGPGYVARLVGADGADATNVTLGANESVPLELRVTAPTGAEPSWDFDVEAASAADPARLDAVIIHAQPLTQQSVDASVATRQLRPTPGAADATLLRLVNRGADVDLVARIVSETPPGWTVTVSPPRVVLRAAGAMGESGDALDRANLTIEARAPPGASVGASLPIVVVIEPALGGQAARVGLLAMVANDYALDVRAPSSLVGAPPENGTAPVTLRSRAAAPFNVTLRSVTAPRGWTATLGALPQRVAPGASLDLVLAYGIAPGAPAAADDAIVLALRLDDGVSPPSARELRVSASTLGAPSLRLVDLPATLPVATGETTRLRVTARNDGNERGALDIAATGADGGGHVELAPGAEGAVELLVPGGAAALSVHALDAAGVDHGATIAIARQLRDVAIVSATRAGPLVNVTLENRGNLAPQLVVRFLRGEVELASANVSAPAPGSRAVHAFLAPHDADRVRVEAADGAPDATPADNLAMLDAAAPARATPAPSFALVLLVALAVAARRRA